MKTGRSTSTPTKAQKQRFCAIKFAGCIACKLRGLGWVPAEIHHLTIGGKHGQKRRGHDFAIGLCGWHHLGKPRDLVQGETITHAIQSWRFILGPSYALEPRAFRETFGGDDALLAYQNELISERTAA